MDNMQKTSIVIPCFNEEERIDQGRFLEYANNHQNVSFIFVNDGSTDETLSVLQNLQTKSPRSIEIVDLNKNSGKAEAVRQGFLHAIKLQFENIGYWDADLATPLDIIDTFLSVLETNAVSVVMGARVMLLGRAIQRKRTRHYLGRIFATVVSMMILKLPVYDTQCGAKIFKNDDVLKRVFSRPFRVNWTFDVEIIARYRMVLEDEDALNATNFIIEYPLDVWRDVGGSKLKCADYCIALFDLVKLYLLFNIPIISSAYRRGLIVR